MRLLPKTGKQRDARRILGLLFGIRPKESDWPSHGLPPGLAGASGRVTGGNEVVKAGQIQLRQSFVRSPVLTLSVSL